MRLSRLLLIAQPGSYRLAPFLAAARRRNIDVLVASRGRHSLVSELQSGLHIDLQDIPGALKVILDAAVERPFRGILGCDDATVELAAMAAAELALPHNSPVSARRSRRKDLARDCLRRAGCAVPSFRLVDLRLPLTGREAPAYPCVLKPLNLSASRGVIRVDDMAGFPAACRRIGAIIAESADAFERTHLLAEQYIDGIEVAYEGYLQCGELHALTLFDKPDPLRGPYFAETIYVTPSVLPPALQQRIHQRVAEACAAYGLYTGPVHAELRIDASDNPWILEVASRTIGGDCSRTLEDGLGFSLEELAIALAIGEVPARPLAEGFRGVMMLPVEQAGILRRVEGLSRAARVPGIDSVEILIPEGHELQPLPEGNQYLGYLFASADSSAGVTAALRQAHALLQVRVAPLLHKQRF